MTDPDLTKWATPAGAMTLYERYWSPATDAPREYIIPCALATIGTVISNRVYISFGGDHLFPNLWQILLGPSSTYRKSTTVKQVRRTLARLCEGEPSGLLFPDEFSKEAMVTKLSEQPQGLLTYSEFSGALAAFGRDYMSGIKELLADLYDSPPKYERLVGQKTITATNVCISMLAASQTDWLLEKLKETDIRGGFMARMTLWPAFYKRRFMAIPADPDAKTGNELIRHLNSLRKLEGSMSLSPSVRERYGTWLERHERELDSLPGAGQLSPFWSRMSVTTLKMALIIHVANAGTLSMADEALESAIGLTEHLKLSLAHLFNEQLAFTPDMKNRQRVLQAIRRHPGSPFRDISRVCSLLKRQLEPVLETLRAEELIEVREGGYWPVSESASVSKSGTDNNRSTFYAG